MLRAVFSVTGKSRIFAAHYRSRKLSLGRFGLGGTFAAKAEQPRASAVLLLLSYSRSMSSAGGVSLSGDMRAVNGKVPMSFLESEVFLDYEKYERNLKIVRER